MQRSNLFAHIELSKFVSGLIPQIDECRASLIAQHSYFTIIPSRMFSDNLAPEWEDICKVVARSGPSRDDEGRIIANAIRNTLRQMDREECLAIVERLIRLQGQVAAEF